MTVILGFTNSPAMPLAAAIGVIDILVVATYMLCILGLGVFFARRNKNTDHYFVASRSYKGWVLGISMLSTTISSVTFLAFPADDPQSIQDIRGLRAALIVAP